MGDTSLRHRVHKNGDGLLYFILLLVEPECHSYLQKGRKVGGRKNNQPGGLLSIRLVAGEKGSE